MLTVPLPSSRLITGPLIAVYHLDSVIYNSSLTYGTRVAGQQKHAHM